MKLEDGKSEHGSRRVETEGGGRQREREMLWQRSAISG